MKPLLTLAIASGLFLSSATLHGGTPGTQDLDKLQGTWDVVDIKFGGKGLPPEKAKGATMVVKDKSYVLRGGDDTWRGMLKLDASRTPKHIDASFLDDKGAEKGKAYGIYELNGDRLKICWREKGDTRPGSFAAASDVRFILLQRHAAKKQ